MPQISIEVPSKLKSRMDSHSFINWEKILRQAIEDCLDKADKFEEMLKNPVKITVDNDYEPK